MGEPASQETLPASFGRYQVLEELGRGSMGIVYLCVDPRLARPVAVKAIKDTERSVSSMERYLERFRREAEAAGRLTHPDIVRIFDIAPSYLVMEYLEGQTLGQALAAGANINVRKAASLVLRIADALDYAHDHGIVHRDVKPGNVMLLPDGGIKVMDFGVAHLEESNLTAAGTVLGSYRYMSPEQMMGEPVDGRTDVFSLGTIAYEMLTGLSPYPARTITEVVSKVVDGKHVPPHQVDARIPPSLDAVFAKVFAPNPDQRHQRAMDFAREFFQGVQSILDLNVLHQAAASNEPPTEIDAGAVSLATRSGFLTVSRGTTSQSLLAVTGTGEREAMLMLDSDPPGAQVYLDGAPVGEAPVDGIEVTLGRHVVRMEAEGHRAVSAEVDVAKARPLKAITITLPRKDADAGKVRPGQFVELSPGVMPPRRVSGNAPAYPDFARERAMEGSPVVELWINEAGDVMDVAIVESAGALLDDAVLQAVAAWRFSPATLDGVPVSVRMTVQHLFRR